MKQDRASETVLEMNEFLSIDNQQHAYYGFKSGVVIFSFGYDIEPPTCARVSEESRNI